MDDITVGCHLELYELKQLLAHCDSSQGIFHDHRALKEAEDKLEIHPCLNYWKKGSTQQTLPPAHI